MTLRKLAGLLAAFGLTLGLIGGGVGAVFEDQVTATENIAVGTFECLIVEPSDGVIAGDQKSVDYTPGTITSSAAGSAPFQFTVENTGSIDAVLSVSTSSVSAPFSIIGDPIADVALAAGATHSFATGVAWTELAQANAGTTGTVTWTVSCGEVPAPAPVTIVHTQIGVAGTGWYGWSCPAGSTIVSGSVDTTLVVDGPAKLGSTVDGVNYPIFPHYTYPAGEEGWVVHNNGGPTTQVLTIVCQP